jgi:hypothetical protein
MKAMFCCWSSCGSTCAGSLLSVRPAKAPGFYGGMTDPSAAVGSAHRKTRVHRYREHCVPNDLSMCSSRTHWLSPTPRYGGGRSRPPQCKYFRSNRTHWLSPTAKYGGVLRVLPPRKSGRSSRTDWLSPTSGYGSGRFRTPQRKSFRPKNIVPTDHSVFASTAARASVHLWRPRHTSRPTTHSLAA